MMLPLLKWKLDSGRKFFLNMHCIDENDAYSKRSWIDENSALLK